MQTKDSDLIEEGRRVLKVEAGALLNAVASLGPSFSQSVDVIHDSLSRGGKIVVSGVGKSGNVAQKVAATLTSTGSMSVFLHPTEALHGDLGLLGPNDVLLVFSHSGSSQELLLMLPSAQDLCRGVVAVLGNPSGPIAKYATAVISSSISSEACPDNLAPTASSTLAMALGDGIAMALKKKAGFGPEKFARIHPGGQLGKRLLARVEDLMHGESDFAMLPPTATMDDVVIALTKFRHSGVCIVEGRTGSGKDKLVGVIVEGDIRRALLKKEAFFKLKASDIMTRTPKSVQPRVRAAEALDLMENRDGQLSFLPVVDEEGGCVGVLRVHDLVLSGLN
ncbi:MAG TPA: KpsF/GutQ family sugar-phosphate isomerase [Bdellovibrionota bacterium]